MLTPPQQWLAELLARNGGFSHKLITSHVFRVNNPDKALVRTVSKFLSKQRALVTEWRNGKTDEAKAYLGTVKKRTRRQKQRKRHAA